MLAKSKFYKKIQSSNSVSDFKTQSYTQVFKDNIKKTIKIKDVFPKISSNKVIEIYKVINNTNQKGKPKFNITTKNPLRKQIIILMSMNNTERVIVQFNLYIANINRLLKEVKFKFWLTIFVPITKEFLSQPTRLLYLLI